jgi:hypothetical protein
MDNILLKNCSIHGDTDYVLRKDGRYRCKKCCVSSVLKRRKNLKEMAVNYKGGICTRCGYNKCIDALEFHHTDPSQKDFAISSSGYTRGWNVIKSELDKCIMVCSNCHKEIHHELNRRIEVQSFVTESPTPF